MPVSLAGKVYRELEPEGIVRRIRGSGTVLQGLSPTRKLSVRGVIAIASSLSCFLTLQDYRTFLIQIRGELRKRDFAAAEVFFEAAESADELAGRLKDCHPDKVIWYCPDRFSKELALRLGDMGIPVVGVSDGGLPGIRCRYEIDRQPAITEIAHAWKEQAITAIKLGIGVRRSNTDEEHIGLTLRELGFEVESVAIGAHSIKAFVKSLDGGTHHGIVLLHSAATLLAMRAPEAFAELARHCRVALVDGPVSLPFARPTNVVVDFVVVDWQTVARHIVDDLLRHELPAPAAPFVFQAKAVFRAPLSRYGVKF